jgi:ATP-binding protein involved in chromosome partitioning
MKILLIGSGKGGVGKSTISVSLALLFKTLGWKVGLIDADIYGPSLKSMLSPDSDPYIEDGLLIPANSYGIQVVSSAYFSKFDKGAPVRAPLVNGVIEQFLTGVKWDNRDLLIIDLPPGTGDIHLTILQKLKIDGAIAVTTPQKISTIDVEKALYLFQNSAVPILGVIENMSYYQDPITAEKHRVFGEGGGEELSKKFSIPFLGQIPIDPRLMESLDSGVGAKFSLSQEMLWKIALEISAKLCDDECEKKIEVNQIDQHYIEVARLGKRVTYRISEIQEQCPCARCSENDKPQDPNVRVTDIQKIGNYAVRFQFTSGCSKGFYTWQNFF